MSKNNKVFTTLGASSHARGERQIDDYYATDPKAIDYLLKVESFQKNIVEPACGEGHLSKKLIENGYKVRSTDLIYRGYGKGGINFFKEIRLLNADIITNPPYKLAQRFVEHGNTLLSDGGKMALFLKVQFLEGKARKIMFKKYPPKKVYISSSRISCAKNGNFDKYSSSAIAYAWFLWVKGFNGDPIVKWIN